MQLHFYLLHMNSAYRLRTRVNLYVSGNPKNARSAYCALDICSKHRSYCLMNMNSCIRTDIALHTIEKITSKHGNIVEFTFLQIVTFPLLFKIWNKYIIYFFPTFFVSFFSSSTFLCSTNI